MTFLWNEMSESVDGRLDPMHHQTIFSFSIFREKFLTPDSVVPLGPFPVELVVILIFFRVVVSPSRVARQTCWTKVPHVISTTKTYGFDMIPVHHFVACIHINMNTTGILRDKNSVSLYSTEVTLTPVDGELLQPGN